MTAPRTVDSADVERLTGAILTTVRDLHWERPRLNALAINPAIVLQGATDSRARQLLTRPSEANSPKLHCRLVTL